jgi:hypothetical protein
LIDPDNPWQNRVSERNPATLKVGSPRPNRCSGK